MHAPRSSEILFELLLIVILQDKLYKETYKRSILCNINDINIRYEI